MGSRGVGWNFDTGLHNTAEAMTSTEGGEIAGTAPSILLGVKLGEEGSRVMYTHHFPKLSISKENPMDKQISWFLSKNDFMVSG